jgi:hypothetical protein
VTVAPTHSTLLKYLRQVQNVIKNTVASSLGLALSILSLVPLAAMAAGFSPVAGPIPVPVAVHASVATPLPSPSFIGAASAPAAVAITPLTPVAIIDPLQPHDATPASLFPPSLMMPGAQVAQEMIAEAGIQMIADNTFTCQPRGDENGDYILVRGDEKAQWEKTSPVSVKLAVGSILVSVRRPSRFALIATPNGTVALDASGDALVSFNDGVLRVDNLSGRGIRCKVKIDGSVLGGKSQSVALAAGYEMVASTQGLTREDARPADGIARRGFSLLANGHMAVNEFSVESFLSSSAIIASIAGTSSDPKEHRILNDMSKMAAVLNYVNGAYGYTAGNTGLATKPGAGTQ